MDHGDVAAKLADLYGKAFGGKASGRYRIPEKLLRDFMKRRRLYPEDKEAIAKSLFERGYVLADMDSFLVVMSVNTFVNYRRVGKDALV